MFKKHQEDVKKQENIAGTSASIKTEITDAKKFTCVMCGCKFNVHMNLIAHFR